jgi:hypothetical protein
MIMAANRKFGYFAFALYSLCAIIAFWLPLVIAIITIVSWIFWLAYGLVSGAGNRMGTQKAYGTRRISPIYLANKGRRWLPPHQHCFVIKKVFIIMGVFGFFVVYATMKSG